MNTRKNRALTRLKSASRQVSTRFSEKLAVDCETWTIEQMQDYSEYVYRWKGKIESYIDSRIEKLSPAKKVDHHRELVSMNID